MTNFGLPHKANVGEIIRVDGYEGKLFLVNEHLEEVSHDGLNSEPCVSYTCTNIDDFKEVRIVFDEDVAAIAVTADKSDAFIEKRQASLGNVHKPFHPPAVQQTDGSTFNILELMRQFEQTREKKAPSKQKLTANEKKRADAKKAAEYLDYLLDSHAMLKSLDAVLGEDETRNEELAMIEEEFHAKSIALYGKHS